MSDKLDIYNAATQHLLHQVQQIQLPPQFRSEYNMAGMLQRFRAAFLDPALRAAVLSPQYEDSRQSRGAYSAGFCGIASFSWGQLFRMPDGSPLWNLVQSTLPDKPHVWLESRIDGQVLDLTYDQFNAPYPYEHGTVVSYDRRFRRAYKFANHLGVDLEEISLINALKMALRD